MTPLAFERSGRSGKVLSRYVKKQALFAMLLAVLGLWTLQVLFAALAEIEDVSAAYTYKDMFTHIAYQSPAYLEQFIPTGALLGAVVGLGLMANSAELIVMRAAGVSVYRIVAWVLQPAVMFVLLALAINQYVLPHSNLLASQVRKPDTPLLASVNGYWTMQHNDNANNSTAAQPAGIAAKPAGNSIVFIDYADAKGNIGVVKRWQLDANNNLVAVATAAGGSYVGTVGDSGGANTTWQLKDISVLTLAPRAAIVGQRSALPQSRTNTASLQSQAQANLLNDLHDKPLAIRSSKSSERISLPISPSSVYLLTRRAEDLSLTQLYAHKLFNTAQGTRSLEHELALWQKLLSPFSVLSLVVVACSFVFGSLRTHSLGLRIVVAVIFGLLFSYMQDLSGFVALATGVSPLLMVLLPIIASALLGMYLLKRQS